MFIINGNEIKAIAFDLEGTAINIEHVHFQGHILAARALGVNIDFDNLEEIIAKVPNFVGGPREEIGRQILALSSGNHTLDEFVERDKLFYQVLLGLEEEIRPRPGFVDVLNEIRKLGLKTTIGTLTPREEGRFLIEKSGIAQLFAEKQIIFKASLRGQKRDANKKEVYLRTAEIMGIDPSNQLVIGDSKNDARAAREIGSPFIGMPVFYDNEAVRNSLLEHKHVRIFRGWPYFQSYLHLTLREGVVSQSKERR